MRQEQSRGKTPAARILSLALALCMIAAFVPAFTLTAGAASYTPSDLIAMADYSFIGDTTASGLSSWAGYAWGGTVAESTNWTGWSGAGQLYSMDGSTLFWDVSTGTLVPNDTVQAGVLDKDFMIISWKSSDVGTFGDYAIIDSSETIIDTFRYRSGNTEGINYTWANTGWNCYYTDTTAQYYTYDVSYSGSYGLAASGTTYYMVYENDEENNQYTASYYYQGSSESSATWVSTKTYSDATFSGLSGIQVGYLSSYERIFNMEIYAGDYPESTATATIIYTVGDETVNELSQTYDSSSATSYTFGEYYYWADGGNTLYYAAETTVNNDETETVAMTALDNPDVNSYTSGGTVEVDGTQYTIQSSNLIPNGDFTYGVNGWFGADGNAASTSYWTLGSNAITLSSNGSSSPYSLYRAWGIEAGKTYLYTYTSTAGNIWHMTSLQTSLYQDEDTAINAGTGELLVGTTSQSNTGSLASSDAATTNTYVFTVDGESTYNYLQARFRWSTATLSAFGLYEVEEVADSSATVTVYYTLDGTADTVISDLTASVKVVKGSTASFDAISNYAYNGSYYSAEALEYTNVQEDATYYITLTEDTSVKAPLTNFTYNFNSHEVEWYTSDKTTTYSTGWWYIRDTIVEFDVDSDSQILDSATLNLTLYYMNSANNIYVYAFDPSYVDYENEGMTGLSDTTYGYDYYGSTTGDEDDLTSKMSMVQVGSTYVSSAYSDGAALSLAISLDLSSAADLVSGGKLALLVRSGGKSAFYSYYTTTSGYAPYLSDLSYTSAVTYTVKYVDENNTSLGSTTYSTTAANTYGYDDEVICPYVTIPYFTGYIFTSKTVDTSDNTITLTYTSTTQVDADSDFGSNFYEDVDDDTQFVSLNMLGAHDAFTSGISSSSIKYDAAGIAQGDSGAKSASLIVAGSSTVANYSKTQDLTALELLEAGVRYFDVRLSRSTTDQDAGTLYNNAPHTNGVFYTTHGVLGEEFRPIAYTIGQWLKEHPGEVISLYFQEAWDDGDATSTTYADIAAILEEAGINDFAPYYYSEGTKLWAVTYGNLTDSGTKAGVVMFARAVGYTQGNFYYGSTSATYSWAGKLYSYYDSDAMDDITSLDLDYIQTQVDTLDLYNSEDDEKGDHPVYHMARVMQAQTESSNLLSQASSDNSALYTALISASTDDHNYSEWLTALPIVMVNGVGDNTDDLAQLLQNCNKTQDITITYVDESGNELATKTKSVVVGSLYTDETEYAIVSNSYADDANSVIYSLETLDTAPYYSYNNEVVFTPSYGLTSTVTSTISDTIEIVAAELTDTVYTVRDGILYSSASGVGSDNGNPAFSAYNWNSDLASPDRVGFAIVTVPDDEVSATRYYALTATQLRAYSDSNCNLNTYFYIVSLDDYNSLDVSDNDAIAELYASATCIATYNKTDYNDDDTTSQDVSYVLDADDISAYAGDTVVIIGTSTVGLYGLDSNIAIEVADKDYGVTLYAGAQIRVGSGMDDEETSATYQELLGDSGLRFIAVVDKTNTMAESASEIGIAIFNGGFGTTEVTAASAKEKFDGTEPVTTITDTTYQDDDETVFTAAIINIDEDNYNRIYVAVPYVIVDGATYYNWEGAVARTPYQVAKGILVDSDETEGYTQVGSDGTEVDSTALAAVLNVYTNKTGARVTIASSDRSSLVAVTYANGATAFFDIASSTDSDGNYVFTLTPTGDSAKFYDYAVDYFRINNASATTFENAMSDASVALTDGNIVITVPAE